MKRITVESECRYDSGKRIGDPGVEYEFDIKMPKLSVDMSNDDFDAEAQDALIDLAYQAQTRYPWARHWYQTGRSGGWFAFVDEDGDATKAKLQVLIDMVSAAKNRFIKRIEREYPG